MNRPLVSVIIPVYNSEKTVARVVGEVLSQSYSELELIIIDDGSKDESSTIIEAIAKKDRRVTIISQENAGPGAARNAGLDRSSGEYIMFVDSDDAVDTNLVKKLVESVTGNSVDFAMCGMSINGKEIVAPDVFINDKKLITQYVLTSLLTKNLLYGPCCKLFRRSTIVDNGIQFPEEVKYGEDTIFVLNYLSKATAIRAVNESLYVYQMTSTGLAATNDSVSKYRVARSEALGLFIKDAPHIKIRALYILLRVRWSIAYIKAFI